MQTPYGHLPEGKIAYIRRIDPATLPEQLRAHVPAGAPLWGVHSPAGECLALTQDRGTAFVVARQNDLTPVSAH